MPLELSDIVGPLPVADFVSRYWGKEVYSGLMEEEELAYLTEAFCRGDPMELAAESRKDDNSRYGQEEIAGMVAELEERKVTLNFPFCFAPGALEVKRAFLEACPGLGNDVEVGVYLSRAGGAPAAWHSDNNHNLTIQICGNKDWLCAPGNPNVTCSRAMQDAPRNRYEQLLPAAPARPADSVCYSLRPGSVLYVPPGHWHSVIPSGGDSCSVDLRVGSVLHAKWICEAVFAGLMSAFCTGRQGPEPPLALGPGDFALGQPSPEAQSQLGHLEKELPALLRRCKPPRCFPFEPEHSDGLHTGASLDFLKKQKFMVDAGCIRPDLVVGVNALVSVTVKYQGADLLIMHLASTSSLSAVDYLRFSLLCPKGLDAAVRHISATGSSDVASLQERCKGDCAGDLKTLLRVLLFANVFYTDEDVVTSVQPSSRKKRRKGEQ